MRRLLLALVLVAAATAVEAQTVTGARFQLTTGPCTLRSGSGAPSTSLGVVCDTYVRTDSPYTVYVKTGASTWSELYRAGGTDVAVADGGTGLSSWTTGQLVYASGSTTLAGLTAVSSGQVLASNGTGAAPVYTASPSVTALTASGAVQGATVTGTTSVTTPTVTASANLTLSPTGDIITSPTGLDILPGAGYTYNLGALTNKYLTLHASELWVETLVAQNTLATIGGRVLVGPTTSLTADLASGATSMSVKHNSLANGDRVLLEANGSVEWIAVASASSGSGPYTYTITRNLDGSGANNWTAGDAVFNTGTTNSGFIDLYSSAGVISGSGPTIVGNVRTGTTYNNIAPRWGVGNINGLCGYGATTYGAFFGDCSNTNITIDATNGFRIRSGTTDKLKADTSGNLSITGDLSVGTSGIIRSGATSYASGTGYVLDYNSGTPRMRIGTTSGDRMVWDGSNLTLVSTNLTVDNSGVTVALAAAGSLSSTSAYKFNAATGKAGLYGWRNVGDTTRTLLLTNESTSTSVATDVNLQANNGTYNPGVSVVATSTTAGSYAELGAFNAQARVSWDGKALITGSTSVTLDGGATYIQNSTAANSYINGAGGLTYLYHAYFLTGPPRWDSGLVQSTVGAAGAASALPANPVAYIKIADVSGNVYVVPAYNP